MIDQLLKIAAEVEPEKLKFVEDSIDKIAEIYRDELIDEQKSIIEECDELLENAMEKQAMFPSLGGMLGAGLKSLPGSIGKGLLKATGAVAVPAGAAMATSLMNDLYNSAKGALTKSKNYEKMMIVNPELQNYDAHKVKGYFDTLHSKGGPEISGDPFIAGSFVQNQLELGGTSLLDQVSKIVNTRKALNDSTKLGPSPKLNFGGRE